MNQVDKDIIFNPDELASHVLLWPGTDLERSILAIFDEDYQALVSRASLLNPAQVGEASVSGRRPVLTCDPADLEGVEAGVPVRVLPQTGLLGTSGGDFTAAGRPQTDGTGLALLFLRKA